MFKKVSFQHFSLVTLIIPILFSCTEIRLIGAYNQHVDETIQTISKDVSTLFVEIENNIDDNRSYSYDTLRNSYIKIEGEIQSCITIANGIPQYRIITKQLIILDSAVTKLKQHHISGFVAPGVTDKAAIKKVVELDKSGITTALSAMLELQEGLKREKADKNK